MVRRNKGGASMAGDIRATIYPGAIDLRNIGL
jgi:hypothetical protein